MEGRRVRRFGGVERERSRRRTLLPLRRTTAAATTTSASAATTKRLSNCCYCDYKISALNQPLFRLGTRFAAVLRPWFSLGLGFALTSLLAVSLLLLFQFAAALRLLPRNSFADLSASLLFGFSPVSTFGISLADYGYLMVSTLISVGFHEFGHALAAASEGIQMDYIAIFLVFLFPGALVAFNYDELQPLSPFSSLRVYCAGIWHNAVCCAVCGLTLFLLPLILFPFYRQGESPMVVAVPSSSPLSPYLSPGDVIVSLDGIHINNAKEWREMASLLNQAALQNTKNATYIESMGRISSRKGYCVPDPLLEKSKNIEVVENQSSCADDLASFVIIPCSSTSVFDYGNLKRADQTHCLNAKEVVKFAKCDDGWMTSKSEGDSCMCSQGESCLSPVQIPGMVWVEVSYSSPYSMKCLQSGGNPHTNSGDMTDSVESGCGGTFVFVGDMISMVKSLQLTSYRPRLAYASIYLPNVLEKISMCTFHVSLTLALLNSLPVYFLDGEFILEASLPYLTSLSPNMREKLLRVWIFAGTLISMLTFFRTLLRFL